MPFPVAPSLMSRSFAEGGPVAARYRLTISAPRKPFGDATLLTCRSQTAITCRPECVIKQTRGERACAAALSVVVGVIACFITWSAIIPNCGPGPYGRTRVQLFRIDMDLECCREMMPSIVDVMACNSSSGLHRKQGIFIDAFGTPIHLSQSVKCRLTPFCGIYSSGPNRIDECGAGDDIAPNDCQ